MECLCAAKISVNFGMCFNGTIRRPWVWKLHWRGFYIGRNIFWKSRFHIYIFNGLLSPTIYSWIFRKNNGRVNMLLRAYNLITKRVTRSLYMIGHRNGGKTVTRSPATSTLLIVRPSFILIFKKRYISYWKLLYCRSADFGQPAPSCFWNMFVKNIQNFGSFCVFQGIFRPASWPNI